jgi:hypothetical protein
MYSTLESIRLGNVLCKPLVAREGNPEQGRNFVISYHPNHSNLVRDLNSIRGRALPSGPPTSTHRHASSLAPRMKAFFRVDSWQLTRSLSPIWRPQIKPLKVCMRRSSRNYYRPPSLSVHSHRKTPQHFDQESPMSSRATRIYTPPGEP